MSYINLPPVPPAPPVGYVARAPSQAKPPLTQAEPKPSVSTGPTHGPAVILGGALARPPERRVRQDPEPPKPAHHVDRVI
jgi:hypothetical protein